MLALTQCTALVAAAAIGTAVAAALWWLYFDVVAIVATRRLASAEPGREQNETARDSYSFIHFPMVAGIVATEVAALVSVSILAVALTLLIVVERRSYGDSRDRLRHVLRHDAH